MWKSRMSPRKTKKQKSNLGFEHKLILNQWLIEQCGYDPLESHKLRESKITPIKGLANILRDCQEGMTADNLHHFYKKLHVQWKIDAQVTQDDLLRYEQNIVSHTLYINENRPNPIVWKYYQWLSLLFVEIYLDRYFGQRDELLDSLNDYIDRFDDYWKSQNVKTDVTKYSIEELNKLCLQNATGSGKTLLMHVNFLQFRHYADKTRFKDNLTNVLLITPNTGMSEQHAREMKASDISTARLPADDKPIFSSPKNNLHRIDFTEITNYLIKNFKPNSH